MSYCPHYIIINAFFIYLMTLSQLYQNTVSTGRMSVQQESGGMQKEAIVICYTSICLEELPENTRHLDLGPKFRPSEYEAGLLRT
jgi:hypothetical protein